LQTFYKNFLHKIIFLLPTSGGGGGAHCIVQEALEMRRLGVDAQIAVEGRYRPDYESNYPLLEGRDRLFYFYDTMEHLTNYVSDFHVAVGTIYHSMQIVKTIIDRYPSILPAYYMQDYEPWFFENGSKEISIARESYTLVPDLVIYAKTRWLCDIIKSKHDVSVQKVICPSYDQRNFYPHFGQKNPDTPIRVAAMIRPRTPRRAAARTMRILKRVKKSYGDQVEIHIFGCTEGEIDTFQLTRGFSYVNHGVLIHKKVADVLRHSDIFIDLSDWQAFGLTGLEAMACGCSVVAPQHGGVHEYGRDRYNVLFVDTNQEDECFEVINELIKDDSLRNTLQKNGLNDAPLFSIYRSVISMLDILMEARSRRVLNQKPSSCVPTAIHRLKDDFKAHRQDVQGEHFVPQMGLELEPYLEAEDKQGIHHLGRYHWVIKVLEERKPNRVLDIACGAGYGSYLIACALPDSLVIGADYDPDAISEAIRTYHRSNLDFVVADVTYFSFGELDVIICFDTIEHVLHREIMMQNIVNHLSSNGCLILSTPIRGEVTLNPGWEAHKIEYSDTALYDFMRRYFRIVHRPEDGSLPHVDYFDRINRDKIRYALKTNPLLCEKPIKHK
jgi:2-polyprenyl-3-methyl-5-hydroxy-6-metoxy-1,4-benzoquinol methylase/glycosyltransferase involved in cell wall biosynthesis